MSAVKTIYRVIKNRDFTQISNAMLHDAKMSWKARGLLCTMLSLPDTWDFHRAHLVTLASDGKDSLASGIQELRSLGYITIGNERDERGRIKRWIMEVYETPVSIAAQDVCPEPENPPLENQNVVNPPLSNNKTNNNTKTKSNIKKLNKKDLELGNGDGAITTEPPLQKSTALKITDAQIENIFIHLWTIYPLKKAKQKALAALTRSLKGKDSEEAHELSKEIWRGLKAHVDEHDAKTQVAAQGGDVWVPELPHLSTWINQRRWEDDYAAPSDILRTAKRKSSILDIDTVF